MRVVFVHPFTQQVSGPDESLLALLGPLSAAGVESHLVVPDLGPLVQRYRDLGVTPHVQRLAILRRRMGTDGAILLGPRLCAGTARLIALFRHLQPDLVHTNMEVVLDGAIAARVLGIPHVMHYRGNTLDSPRRLFDLLTLLWTSLSDRVFCISRATAEIFRKRGRDKNVRVLYNPIVLGSFRTALRSHDLRQRLGAGPNQPLVITMGRINPRKDLETFIRACARVALAIPDARFAIVGSAESPVELAYYSRLLNLAQSFNLGNRLTFAGARQDIAAVMKATDVFVLASRHEGFGRVVAEAMAAGTPVVASREGALPELIEEPLYGLGATPTDDADFGRQIVRLIEDETLRAKIGIAAMEHAKCFDSVHVARQVLQCYEELIFQRSRRNHEFPDSPVLYSDAPP